MKTSYTSQQRAFPNTSTAEFQSLQNQAVAYLVQRAEYSKEADDLEIKITDSEIQKKVDEVKKQYFQSDQKKFEAGLKQQGYTVATLRRGSPGPARLREDLRGHHEGRQGLRRRPADAVRREQGISTRSPSRATSVTSSSRRRRRPTSSTRSSRAAPTSRSSRRRTRSTPGSKDQGGKLTISRGQTVAPFDKAAFSLKTNELSQPVKTEFGYHLIQPLAAVKAGSVTPFSEVKAQIKTQLLEERKNKAVSDWAADTEKKYDGKITYAAGFEPPATSTGAGEETTTGE